MMCFFAALLIHAILCRFPWDVNRVIKFLAAGAPLGVILIGMDVKELGISTEAFAGVFLYAFLSELYLFVFGSVATSVSVSRLLVFREDERNRREIQAAYTSRAMVQMRLKALIAEGLLEEIGSGYRATRKGRTALGYFRSLKRFFGHQEGLVARSSKA